MAINNVVLVGRLARDPELRKTPSNLSVATFTIAVDDGYGKQGGTSTTSFIPCQAWSNTAENVQKFCHKGSLIGVSGRLSQRSYAAKDGTKRTVFEVICNQVQFLETKKAQGISDIEEEDNENKDDQPVEGIDSSDDDLPF